MTAINSLADERSGRATQALIGFREDMYDSFDKRADALFELTDALLCAPAVPSIAHLSLEGVFRRSYGSAYGALVDGEIDETAIWNLLAKHPLTDGPPVFALDESVMPRRYSECSADREFHHSSKLQTGGHPVVAGWSYQWTNQINPYTGDSWTAPIHVARVTPDQKPNDVAVDQILQTIRRLECRDVPLFVLDAGYSPVRIAMGLGDAGAQLLVRVRDDRVLYRDPPPQQGPRGRGRPTKHGDRFSCADEKTWGAAPANLVIENDETYGQVQVDAWSGLHAKDHGPDGQSIKATLIRVQVEHLSRGRQGPRPLWLWWSGHGELDLDLVWRAYMHRFDIEHTFRFYKGHLGWDVPAVMTPEQVDRWTILVAVAHRQIQLAQGLAQDLRLPWERKAKVTLTPGRLKRDFPRLLSYVGTPASPPKFCKPGPGRPKGSKSTPATRFPVITKDTLVDAEAD